MKAVAVRVVAALSLVIASQATSLGADNYKVDPSHTAVIFGISHMGFSYTYGRFNKVDGKYVLDDSNPAACSFELTIDAGSIDTNDPKRDGHLRQADFLNTGEFPLITFKSTAVTGEKNDKGEMVYQVTGDLNLHGVARPVTLPLRLLKVGEGMDKKKHSGFICEARLSRSEFGMTKYLDMVGDEVAVTISFEGGVE